MSYIVNGEQNLSDDKGVVRALGEENTGQMNLNLYQEDPSADRTRSIQDQL